ncbi:Vacuolar protein sorting-associated protein ist1 [Basidiobolus ranarum]|uniref:Vacuolar protein sorting-associated protein ist1 n=1 Tax=Basidiobolus ranarum TaxID=34480 RepID=A0ABR2WYH3_9FUNG
MPSSFSGVRLKVQLKLTVNRLKMLQAKKKSLNNKIRKELALLLEAGKEESAKIRVERVIMEDFHTEALEILELYCELLLSRFGYIEQINQCDPAIIEAVHTIIYAGMRISEVKEFLAIRDQFAAKYGREFVVSALDNRDNTVNPRIIHKLQVHTPEPFLVNQYLSDIAKAYNVNWKPDDESLTSDMISNSEDLLQDVPALSSTQVNKSPISDVPQGSNSQENDKAEELGTHHDFPQTPVDNPKSSSTSSSNSGGPKSANDNSGLPDLDELTRRFEALKKRK